MSYYPSQTSQNGIKHASPTPILSHKRNNHTHINTCTPSHQINRNTYITPSAPKKAVKRIKLKSTTTKTIATKTHCKSIPNINNISGGGILNNHNHNHNHHKYKRIKNNNNSPKNIQKTHKKQPTMSHSLIHSTTEPETETETQTKSKQTDPILMLPNIETPFIQPEKRLFRSKSLNDKDHQPLRKKRKISLRVPKCKVGDSMECEWCDDPPEWRLCTIIAVKSKEGSFLYYIHYTDYNRRLDQWVSGPKLRKPTGKIKKPSQLLLENTNNKRLTRGQKRAVFEQHHIDIDEFEEENNNNNEDELYEKIHLKTNKIKNIEKIQFGKYIIDCWYFSPYPEEYIGSTRLLYICEYCLKYMKFYNTYVNHMENECFIRHPPGNEIYRFDGISVWEVDGCIDKIYCQNLCLLAKLFFDHKTLYFDVSPFLFYIICEYGAGNDGFHLVGYFSKEKNSPEGYNLACILTMPHKQKLGYGRFIISLSYELSKKEEKLGSPEKPLSDLGKISYKSYWIEAILQIIETYYGEITIKQISQLTSFTKEDIVNSLKEVNMLNCYKGQHVVKYRAQSIKKYLAQFEKRRRKRKNIFYEQHLHWNSLKIKPKSHPWNGLSSFHK